MGQSALRHEESLEKARKGQESPLWLQTVSLEMLKEKSDQHSDTRGWGPSGNAFRSGL